MCLNPIVAYPSPSGGPLSFVRPPAHSGRTVTVPCRYCLQCRLRREADLAQRLVDEARYFSNRAWFATGTLGPEHAHADSSVDPDVARLFLKRVRHKFGPTRYMSRGEYGDVTNRAHYHWALFGPDVDDLKHAHTDENGFRVYESATMSALWPFGFFELCPLDTGTARYMARYIARGFEREAVKPWDYVHPDGTVVSRHPPFLTWSRRPGIGRRFVEDYGQQFAAGDFVVVNGRKAPTPAYYRDVLDQLDPELAGRLAADREAFMYSDRAKEARRPHRLAAKGAVLKAKLGASRRASGRVRP